MYKFTKNLPLSSLFIVISLNIISFSSPFSPSSENLGACLVGVAKCEFPLPPLPPFNISSTWSGFDKSATTFPVSASFTTVPIGTFTYKGLHENKEHNY